MAACTAYVAFRKFCVKEVELSGPIWKPPNDVHLGQALETGLGLRHRLGTSEGLKKDQYRKGIKQ